MCIRDRSYACQMQSLSSLNEFRMSTWQRFESKLLQIMRNSKTKKITILIHFAERQKREFPFACRNTSVPEDQMRRGDSMIMKVTSYQYEHHSQAKYCKSELVIFWNFRQYAAEPVVLSFPEGGTNARTGQESTPSSALWTEAMRISSTKPIVIARILRSLNGMIWSMSSFWASTQKWPGT